MVNKQKTFKQNLIEIQEFLSSRKQLSVLANKCKVSLRTVYNTFEANEFDHLKGKQIDVYRESINMITEIKSLQNQATDALK